VKTEWILSGCTQWITFKIELKKEKEIGDVSLTIFWFNKPKHSE
jgi:hypothetical protein